LSSGACRQHQNDQFIYLFFFSSIRSCAGNAKSVALRTAALRALSHFCRSDAFVRSINATGVDYFIVGSLERDATAAAPAIATSKSANSAHRMSPMQVCEQFDAQQQCWQCGSRYGGGECGARRAGARRAHWRAQARHAHD
jgi:hypothetical protein